MLNIQFKTNGCSRRTCSLYGGASMAVMIATVLKVQKCDLLVCDLSNDCEVLVHCAKACCFCVDDKIRIEYSGIMTMSIPPQISATCITCC